MLTNHKLLWFSKWEYHLFFYYILLFFFVLCHETTEIVQLGFFKLFILPPTVLILTNFTLSLSLSLLLFWPYFEWGKNENYVRVKLFPRQYLLGLRARNTLLTTFRSRLWTRMQLIIYDMSHLFFVFFCFCTKRINSHSSGIYFIVILIQTHLNVWAQTPIHTRSSLNKLTRCVRINGMKKRIQPNRLQNMYIIKVCVLYGHCHRVHFFFLPSTHKTSHVYYYKERKELKTKATKIVAGDCI